MHDVGADTDRRWHRARFQSPSPCSYPACRVGNRIFRCAQRIVGREVVIQGKRATLSKGPKCGKIEAHRTKWSV
jgi:hypothetical protein